MAPQIWLMPSRELRSKGSAVKIPHIQLMIPNSILKCAERAKSKLSYRFSISRYTLYQSVAMAFWAASRVIAPEQTCLCK